VAAIMTEISAVWLHLNKKETMTPKYVDRVHLYKNDNSYQLWVFDIFHAFWNSRLNVSSRYTAWLGKPSEAQGADDTNAVS